CFRYDNLGVEVSIYKRSTGWFGCGWLYLPSFGLISDYHLCDDNPSCPIAPGRQIFEITIDPSILFSGFFKMFHNDQVPYQLILRVRNNRQPSEELLCMAFQTRIHY
uniref:ML domain-containing protein n=1 Tax=Syphacia muris TaxID=451379 RepID=A0A0N5ACV8_9BILA